MDTGYPPSTYATGDPFPAGDANALKGAADAGGAGLVMLDSFAGVSDDAMLTAAMSYAAAQTYPPTIQLGNRQYNFATARTPYDGFRIQGTAKLANSELSAVNMYNQVHLTCSGPWLSPGTSTVHNCYVGGITFLGSSSTTFMANSQGGMWFGLCLRDVGFHSFLSVLGTQSQSMVLSCCLFDGWWQVQGNYTGAIHVGGSDSRLWVGGFGCLMDASPAYNGTPGQFHFWFDSMDNTTIGHLYITAEGPWGGIRVDGPAYNSVNGPSNRGAIAIAGAAIEGRNASQPCYGALIRVNGGTLKLRDSYVGRGMSNPSAMGHSPVDAGYVHVAGGYVLLDGTSWDRAGGQSETVPMVYLTSGATVRAINSDRQTKGGVWTGLPQIKNDGGTLYADDTHTVQA